MTNSSALWQQLQQAGLVTGDLPIQPAQPQPAFVLRLLLGVSGWVSALFFTAFITVLFINLLTDDSSFWLVGLGLCVLSIGLSRMVKIPLLMQQFIFSCSLAGQAQIIFGVWQISASSQVCAVLLLAIQIPLFLFIKLSSQRSAAVLIACAAIIWLLGQQFWVYALPALSALTGWLWLSLVSRYRHAAYLQPATIGLTLALWASIALTLIGNSTEFAWLNIIQHDWQTQLWIATALSSLVCLVLAWQLIKHSVQHAQLRSTALVLSLGVGLVNLKMPGLAPMCLLLCIGVAQAQSRLIACNLVCLTGYLMLYYYSLNNTLLYKSILMCSSGFVLLVVYGVLKHYADSGLFPSAETNTDA